MARATEQASTAVAGGRARSIAFAVGLLYGLFYLWVIGDITFYGPPAWGGHIAELSLERALSARSTLMFEAVAVLEAGYLVWLISPVNLLIAGILCGLLAANIHGALWIRAQPAACRPGQGGTLAAAVPALFAGGACCAPSLILLLGIPGLGAFAAFFGWLVPISIAALGLSRVWQHRQGAPKLFGTGPGGQAGP